MKRARDFRKAAWADLHGKWGRMAAIVLIYMLLTAACALFAVFGVGVIATILITGPLLLGIATSVISVAVHKTVQIEMIFHGFRRFGESFVLWLLITIFTFLWSLLVVIPGIVKSYSYSMSWFILAENPEMAANAARKMSMERMRGNKWRLFCLDMSFLGWWILCILTFGILSFWIIPYHETARAEFYRTLIAENTETPDEK